ncbi:MAG: alkaline phosphatase family protein, partial [bacterium]
ELLSILDIAPVILYTLGLPVPEDFEGRVPDEIFEPAQMRIHPVVRESPTQSLEVPEPPVAETAVDMEAEVLKQLRALGYME